MRSCNWATWKLGPKLVNRAQSCLMLINAAERPDGKIDQSVVGLDATTKIEADND